MDVDVDVDVPVPVPVPVPMRDGAALATDVWRPEGSGPLPALLPRTPEARTRPQPPRR
ncbi:CocE/NonD family hydrolase [Streptomyces griseoaurantiacus]|uniref:X-Pro dipeptidyl-peptidase (S15 family) n=1 Tax=Streptomyces griseoaurantiacus TaxID=68213 RepID=A0A1G7C2X9_9ACTN|nr:CocE/NonD family hydrolase [Streptomyces jietaisiensis]SDE32775.1 X-Pro dipeptidyl-peptidase (S15 family) [Streptomyces jietaisiensis]